MTCTVHNPDLNDSEILPEGWHEYAKAKRIPDGQIFSSWRKFKQCTRQPFELKRWTAWIDRERVTAPKPTGEFVPTMRKAVPARKPTRKEKPKAEWTPEEWNSWVTEALDMYDLAMREPGIFRADLWRKEYGKRKAERAAREEC